MPRGRSTRERGKKNSVTSVSTQATDTTFNSETSSIEVENIPPINLWSTEIEEKFEYSMKEIDNLRDKALNELKLQYEEILMRLPAEILNQKVDLNDEQLMKAFMALDEDPIESETSSSEPDPDSPILLTTVRRRRSRSLRNIRFEEPEPGVNCETVTKSTRLRSSSADSFKTPMNKVRLSEFKSAKKYTVSKPTKAEDTGIHMRRVMKPDEEAISTCGSPLFVHSGTVSTPHVNIPLPGGVVLNIEPKSPKGPVPVPVIDARTRQQIKLLCTQLQNMF